MTPAALNRAIATAEEFLHRARQVQCETITPDVGRSWQQVVPGKDAAAAKRASLDLTRALADLRRAGT